MTALNIQGSFLHIFQGNTGLGTADGGGGLEGCGEDHGHAAGDAAKNAACIVGGGDDFSVHYGKIIVAAAARNTGAVEADAEFNALHSRNAVDNLGDLAFHTAEHGLADAGGETHDGAFDDAANTVTGGFCPGDPVPHGFSCFRIQYRKVWGYGFDFGIHGIKVRVAAFADGQNVGADADAHLLQPLLAQAARNAQGSSQPAGEMSAAGSILEAAVLDLGGVVRVTGPGTVFQILIISGAGIRIVDHGGNGCAAGVTVQDATQKFRFIFLFPGAGPVVLTRGPAVQKFL